jgi:acetyl-CoA acetyltransferase family protein
MTDVVILSAVRTPIGRARKGSLVDVDSFNLAEVAVRAAVQRSGIDPTELDDLILAESMQGGGVIARHTAVRLGFPDLPGLSVNRYCAAGLSAVSIGAASIRADMDRVVVTGGTESLSSMPRVLKAIPASSGEYRPWMSPSHPATDDSPPFDMSITVGENTARIAGVTRKEADAWACMSHHRAASAVADGRFAEEIVPVKVPVAGREDVLVTKDEHPRPNTTIEILAELPVLHPELPGATVTAGNAAGLNDGAAALVLADSAVAKSHGLEAMARVLAWAAVGVAPERTGLSPILAIPKALARAGVKLQDVDLFEINEAFCSVAVASARELGIDRERTNVNGSGCGLGHPIAATGARMVVTMIHELRRRGASLGCVAMCAGGGMGAALVVEAL